MEATNYIQVMIQSLEKKSRVLDLIIKKNEAQEILFSRETYDDEALEQNIHEKGALIDQLNELDDGYETLFGRVKDELETNKAMYADQIKEMQSLIRTITDKSVKIQSQEAKNKMLAEKYFSHKNHELKQKRSQFKAVNAYRDSLYAGYQPTAQFLNKKK